MDANNLVIRNLHVSVDGKEILKGINLTIEQGKIHAIMGPNGSGKSTLAYSLAGQNRPWPTRWPATRATR
jgi:Fe-S cluster assembly ATP-binding protein